MLGMQKVILLCGIPASGKSSYAKNKKNYIVVSSDEIRISCLPEGYYHPSEVTDDIAYNKMVEDLVWRAYERKLRYGLKYGQNVILDATHLKLRWWEKWHDIVRMYDNVKFIGVDFQINIDRAIKNDSKRERKVGYKMIEKMYKEKQPLSNFKEYFDQVITIFTP